MRFALSCYLRACAAIGVAVGGALLASCSGGGSQAGLPGSSDMGAMRPSEAQVRAAFAHTNAMGFAPAINHTLRTNRFSLLPLGGAKKPLIYVSDVIAGAVEVFDYPSGTYLGEASFEYPYGECSDRAGNVYVADFDAQTISEIAEGTATVIKVVDTPKGYPNGCAINPKNGDLAVTLWAGGYYGSGSIVIYSGGISGSPATYTFTEFTWPAGYDGKGNLYAQGKDGECSGCVWTLQAGKGYPQAVSWNGDFELPGAIELNKNVLMFGQQTYENENQTAIYPTTCSGTTCTSKKPILLTDTCYNSYVDVLQWAEDSKEPNLQSEGKAAGADAIAAGNLYCSYANPYYIYMKTWSLRGGNPTGSFGPLPYSAFGQTIVN